MPEVLLNLGARLDDVGSAVRLGRLLDLVSEVLVGDLDDRAAAWWRELADELDGERGDRCRQIAALIEAGNL